MEAADLTSIRGRPSLGNAHAVGMGTVGIIHSVAGKHPEAQYVPSSSRHKGKSSPIASAL